ncbi:MAG: copper chaperone PCu(A)C [Hyphomonadaceae bacterium]
MKQLIGLIALLLAACGAQTTGLKIDNATYRAPLVDGVPGVAYFSITSTANDRIVGISSPQAQAVEIHGSSTEGGMATMQKLDQVELPAGKTVTFGPGGLHVMVFTPVPRPANATFPIQITLESGRTETISFTDETAAK